MSTILGVPAAELTLLAALIVAAGVITGVLAGLFGIGGGALIVPVLYTYIFGFTRRLKAWRNRKKPAHVPVPTPALQPEQGRLED